MADATTSRRGRRAAAGALTAADLAAVVEALTGVRLPGLDGAAAGGDPGPGGAPHGP